MWREYHANFLDPEFCQRFILTYKNELGKLPLTQIQRLDKASKNSVSTTAFEGFLSYDPRKEEQFIVNDLKDQLVNYFYYHTANVGEDEEERVPYFNYDVVEKYLSQTQTQSGGANGNVGLFDIFYGNANRNQNEN